MDSIRKRREELGFSIAELSRRSGVSRSFISEVELGTHNPSFSTLTRLVMSLSDTNYFYTKTPTKVITTARRTRKS